MLKSKVQNIKSSKDESLRSESLKDEHMTDQLLTISSLKAGNVDVAQSSEPHIEIESILDAKAMNISWSGLLRRKIRNTKCPTNYHCHCHKKSDPHGFLGFPANPCSF